MKIACFCFSLLLLLACGTKKAPSEPLNIIIVLTDDQGYGDLGLHGNPIIKTPNLDRLGRESVRFTNFHVGTTCAPTRSGLMSGIHCNRAGAWHTVIGRSFLSTRFPTMADYFQEGGYRTGIFGKWHLGDNYPYRPQDRGFDKVLVHGGGGVGQTPDYWNNDYFDDTYFEDGRPKKFEGYCTDIWFDGAMQFISNAQAAGLPFLCYISTNAPHGPHHVAQKYIDLYEGEENVVNPNFYGQITNIDDNLGRLEKMLEEKGLKENTLLVFLTDNGTAAGASLAEGQYVEKGYNAGMRGKKGSEYEGGHRVPLFLRFPERWAIPVREFGALTSYTDILPTLLDLVDIEPSPAYEFDGTSLLKLLQTGAQPALDDRILITDTQRQEEVESWKNTAVMKNNWRLVNQTELYDLTTDPEQRNNLIEQHEEMAKALSAAYDRWWAAIADDIQRENLITIGNPAENPTLLTAHDWHTAASPPWHQQHIRTALVDKGEWRLSVASPGQYRIRLYRYPPYLNTAFNQALPPGEPVPGGTPYPPAKGLNWVSSRILLQGQEKRSGTSVDDRYFEYLVTLEAGPAILETWVTDDAGEVRGAYFVEVLRLEV